MNDAAAYAAYIAELEATCSANTTRGAASDPYSYGCELPVGHDGPHIVTDPLGPDTGTYAWRRGTRLTRVEK